VYELRKQDTGLAAGGERPRSGPPTRWRPRLGGALFRLQIEASVKFLRKCELVHTEAN
jgi:hypothetical protein